jgi:hypothetical protein
VDLVVARGVYKDHFFRVVTDVMSNFLEKVDSPPTHLTRGLQAFSVVLLAFFRAERAIFFEVMIAESAEAIVPFEKAFLRVDGCSNVDKFVGLVPIE